MLKVIIKPQSEFKHLERYRKAFAITPYTIFAYDNVIYSNTIDLPHFLLVHESTHFRQQEKEGLENWVDQFLVSPEFRLKQEIEAYKNQLTAIHNKSQRRKIRMEIAEHLSSSLYGSIITKEECLKQII